MNKFEILCLLEAIKSFAYDMHYQAKGSLFYNDHLFAEKISDIYDRDDFIETFFLGEFESAPSMREIYQRTIELTPAILDDMSKNYDTYLRLSAKALLEIENFEGSKAEQDILGKIAHNLQKYSGLVWRELLESGISEDGWITIHPNDENPEDYRRLFVPNGKTVSEAIQETYKKKENRQRKSDKHYEDYEKAVNKNEEARKKLQEEEKKLRDFAKKEGLGLYDAEKRYNDAETYTKARDEYRKTLEEKEVVFSKSVEELSSSIKETIADYSKNTDELVSDFDKIPDKTSEIYDKIKSLRNERDDIYKKREDGKITQPELFSLLTDNTLKIKDAQKEKKSLEEQQIIENAKVLNRKDTDFKLNYTTNSMNEESKKLKGVLDGFIGNDILKESDVVNIKKLRDGGRAHETQGVISITKDDDLGVSIHEYMHFIEEKNPRVLMNSLAFAKMRTGEEKTKSLATITGNRSYKGEYTKKDKFWDAYCGKVYSIDKNSYNKARASEIMSMGVERLFKEPKKFAKEDREYFNFVIANIKGDI